MKGFSTLLCMVERVWRGVNIFLIMCLIQIIEGKILLFTHFLGLGKQLSEELNVNKIFEPNKIISLFFFLLKSHHFPLIRLNQIDLDRC